MDPNPVFEYFWAAQKEQCRIRYKHIIEYARDPVPAGGLLLSVAIVLLTISIEIVAHYNFNVTSKTEISHDNEDDDGREEEETHTKRSYFFHPNPPPSMRARRFACTTLLVMLLCTAFGFRVNGTLVGEIWSQCRSIVGNTSPNWPLFILFSIIPFVSGCLAWLRTLVDCILVRYGKRLGYPSAKHEPGWWPVAAPYSAILILALRVEKEMRKAVERLQEGAEARGKESQAATDEFEERVRLVDAMDETDWVGEDMSDHPPV